MKTQISNFNFKKAEGFTLIELVVIIGILIILIIIAFPGFNSFKKESDLENSTEEIISTLRLAQAKALASEGASQYGVFFNTSTDPHRYILFKGINYSSRATSSDEIHNLPKPIEIYEIDLWSGKETVFERVTGYVSSTSPLGKVSIRLKTDLNKTKTIYIADSGLVGLTVPAASSPTDRLTDSRHIHFDYSREISTSTEKLILTFTYDSSNKIQEIPIVDNIKEGQIFWEGEVDVNGEKQKIKIHTHRLNNPDTQFCVHRDRRYNNKALTINVDGDASGSLINYTADGQESRGTSIFLTIGEAGDPQRQ